MEINEILAQLKNNFGDRLDVKKVTEMLNGADHSKLSLTEIIEKVKNSGALLGDLDGDGVVESPIEEIKGKAEKMFGSLFGKK